MVFLLDLGLELGDILLDEAEFVLETRHVLGLLVVLLLQRSLVGKQILELPFSSASKITW